MSIIVAEAYLMTFKLEKTIFKQEIETIYGINDYLWRLKFYVIS